MSLWQQHLPTADFEPNVVHIRCPADSAALPCMLSRTHPASFYVFVRLLAAAAVLLLTAPATHAQSVKFDRLLRIGEDIGRQEYSFGFIADAVIAPDSMIYVLDAANAEVRVFDRSGRHVRTLGRRGNGPGEFRRPTKLLLQKDRLLVADVELQRFVAFSLDGRHLETRRIEPPIPADLFVPLRDSLWLIAESTLRSHGVKELIDAPAGRASALVTSFRRRNANTVGVFRLGSVRVDTILRYDNGRIQYLTPAGAFGFVRGYRAPEAVWAVSGDSMIATVDAFEGNLRVYKVQAGRIVTVRRGRIPLSPVPIAERDWHRLASDAGFSPSPGARLIGPPYVGQISSVMFASDGSLWVARVGIDSRTPTNSNLILVIPADGAGPQFHVQPPEGLSILRIYDGRLVGVRLTAMGAHVLELWHMTAGPASAGTLRRQLP
jgi:hypothetical protein